MILTLNVSHNLFLTKEQRYTLCDGNRLRVVGVSVPVWFHKGKTSEPAMEVFCEYDIIPTKYSISIKHNSEINYTIELPLNSHNPELNRNNPVTLKNLLDYKEQGCEWLAFKQFSKVKKNNKNITISHFVEIKRLEELFQTMFDV